MMCLLPCLLLLTVSLASCGALPLRAVRQPLIVPILHERAEAYQVVAPWDFEARGAREDVPRGLVVDGASVPRLAWWFMSPDGLHRAAALAHDWTYILQGRLRNGVVLTREQADQQFYDHMIECGIGRWRAGTAYRCVRLGGWRAWNSCEEPVILPVMKSAPGARSLKPFLFRHLYDTP